MEDTPSSCDPTLGYREVAFLSQRKTYGTTNFNNRTSPYFMASDRQMTQYERSQLLHEVQDLVNKINHDRNIVFITTTTFTQVELDCLNGWVFNVNNSNLMTYALDRAVNKGREAQMQLAHAANYQRNHAGGFLFTRDECYHDIINVLLNGVRYESVTTDQATRADIIARAHRWGETISYYDMGASWNR
jgi:hypothetical protein